MEEDTKKFLNPYIVNWLEHIELNERYTPNIILYDFVNSDISKKIIEMNL